MKRRTKTKINVNVVTEQRLRNLALTDGESIENIIVRLLSKYEGLLWEEKSEQ